MKVGAKTRLAPRWDWSAVQPRRGWQMFELTRRSPFWRELRLVLNEEMTDLAVDIGWLVLCQRDLGYADDFVSKAYLRTVQLAVHKAQARLVGLVAGQPLP